MLPCSAAFINHPAPIKLSLYSPSRCLHLPKALPSLLGLLRPLTATRREQALVNHHYLSTHVTLAPDFTSLFNFCSTEIVSCHSNPKLFRGPKFFEHILYAKCPDITGEELGIRHHHMHKELLAKIYQAPPIPIFPSLKSHRNNCLYFIFGRYHGLLI